VAPFQWVSEGGATALWSSSTCMEVGGSRWCTVWQCRPQAAAALPNEGGRRSPRWAVLGQSGHTDRAAAGPDWAEWADAGREQSYGSDQNH
jgi:hypothetical protein